LTVGARTEREINVAFPSSRTRMTVPPKISPRSALGERALLGERARVPGRPRPSPCARGGRHVLAGVLPSKMELNARRAGRVLDPETIDIGDQGLGGFGAVLVGAQRLGLRHSQVLPFSPLRLARDTAIAFRSALRSR
jgi:hypothetical protein